MRHYVVTSRAAAPYRMRRTLHSDFDELVPLSMRTTIVPWFLGPFDALMQMIGDCISPSFEGCYAAPGEPKGSLPTLLNGSALIPHMSRGLMRDFLPIVASIITGPNTAVLEERPR